MWRKYRRLVAMLQAFLLLGLPFAKIGGQSAVRFDTGNLTMYFFGSVIRINEFYLILAAVLFMLLSIVAVSAILGRVYCGWLCPQTLLLDFSSDVAGLFSKKHGAALRRVVLIPMSVLAGFSIIGYFIPPEDILRLLFNSKPVFAATTALSLVIYTGVAWLGRGFCAGVCPYSMLQNALFDDDTQVIAFDRSRSDDCLKCRACVNACPVGIDIREGLGRECVACAGCIDACIKATAKKGIRPFISYSGKVVRPKTFMLGGTVLVAAIVFAALLYFRPDVNFIVARDPIQPVKGVNRYVYALQNNTGKSFTFRLTVDRPLVLIGEPEVTVPPYSIKHGMVMIKAKTSVSSVTFNLVNGTKTLKREAGFL
ncbi:MAG: 4Fe-4S binding protein [Nitrospirae bacterium]|nr:4Fe-4S binding protein [Nitrospirota bacterium]